MRFPVSLDEIPSVQCDFSVSRVDFAMIASLSSLFQVSQFDRFLNVRDISCSFYFSLWE